ncbi:DUF6902 family protein [Roseivivax sp. CAU 1761]
MANILPFPIAPRPDAAGRLARLLGAVAELRRDPGCVFWLKECAELLNVAQAIGAPAGEAALIPLRGFYDSARERFAFFPQYYRFLLSIILDLEDLGLPGGRGAELVAETARRGLAEAELSDLQRMEAHRLMARRDGRPLLRDAALVARLRDFAAQSATFALPNKKAAYELTHIVFYLSEYGRRDPDLPPAALTSLHYAGLLAFIERNSDLMAEICIALRYAGRRPPQAWTAWLAEARARFVLRAAPGAPVEDAWHDWLVGQWWAGLSGAAPFDVRLPEGALRIQRRGPGAAPLREVSQALYAMGGARSGDWHRMRPRLEARLSADTAALLDRAAASCDGPEGVFEGFFEGFARPAGGLRALGVPA